MKILVVNAGSSSLKYQCIDMTTEQVICKGNVERIGAGNAKITHSSNVRTYEHADYIANHSEALQLVIKMLLDDKYGVVKDIHEISAIGHRVLHTGEDFDSSVVITDEVIKILEKNIPLGPLHMPKNIDCIKACKAILPDTPMVAVFDTAFHMTMPPHAYMYAIRYEDYQMYKARKYGFHGTSHKYVSQKAVRMLAKADSKIITCHLGNGSSITAVRDGKSVDTSMGLTPLEGLMMGTRSGDIDPACLEYLMNKKKMDIHEMVEYLNNQCGFKGICGNSGDARDVVSMMQSGDPRGKLGYDMFTYRVRKYIGAYTAALGGLDAIVFTGGIGENSHIMREGIMRGLEYLGIDFDYELNSNLPKGKDMVVSKENSKVKVFVIPTNEELVIARETKELVEG